MTIVITGGSGFIGTHLSKRLVERGYTVVIIDIFSPVFTHEQLFFIKCDISVSPLPYEIMEKADVVINLVGKNIYGKWTDKLKKEIENKETMPAGIILFGVAMLGGAGLMRWKGMI